MTVEFDESSVAENMTPEFSEAENSFMTRMLLKASGNRLSAKHAPYVWAIIIFILLVIIVIISLKSQTEIFYVNYPKIHHGR